MHTEAFNYKALAASSALTVASNGGGGALKGILCCTSTSAIINVWDNTAASGTKIIDSLTLVAGTFYPMPAAYTTGLYVELVSGSGKWTAFWD